MERKDFLVKASLAAFAVSACGTIKPTQVGTEEGVEGSGGFEGDCATTNDILGPFYRAEAPTRADLTFEGLTGSVVEIKGRVLGPGCATPVENALVEIWHCDTNGDYDNDSERFDHRAKWTTNKKGEYSFTTVLPGKYLNGGLFRPAHVHFRVSGSGMQELISQIYFTGDPHITKDPWASQPKAELRVLPIILEDTKGKLAVNFDVFLNSQA
ncbi:MAG: catechol 1,2-dioxygenase [Flavobacteriaceae bacterium]|jgi:catechol 1,2-dioxygenase